ncbi:unnamed protein product [Mytilus coruscus]|uniref:B box-type domain-containing protein n=1 Tax=Mytilus coruscus TaxID=42192 RepID=A0A6J8AIY0_MYTCO|nr:unnamed protein product [Mytilus coruscus]
MVAKQLKYVVCNRKVLEKVVVSLVHHKIKDRNMKLAILQYLNTGSCRLLEDDEEKFRGDLIYALDMLIECGSLTIKEISYTLKLMAIVSTAECVMILEEQNDLWKGLVQCVAQLDPSSLADLEQDRHTFRIGLKLKTITARSMVFTREEEKNASEYKQSFSIRIINSQRFPGYVHYGLKTRSNIERDSLFATYSTEERKNLLWLIAQQIHSIIGSNQDGIEGGVKHVIRSLINLGPITDNFLSFSLHQDLPQTSTTENWFMNSLKADRRIKVKIEKAADRTGMSEKHIAIMAYCVNRFISHHELMIQKEEALSLQRLTQDMSRITFQRSESNFHDNSTDDCLGTSIEMNLQDTSGLVSMKINGELRKEEYLLFTNTTKCQLCVDRNKAVNWCNTCGKNICGFCKVFHQKVWDVMDHDILPLPITY